MDSHSHAKWTSIHNTNTRTDHITKTSTPLNTSGGRKTERESERGGKNDEVGLEHQTINSPLSLWVEGLESWGWEGRYWGGGGRGMMGVYLKHGDPMAEGCLGAGMNKTLMAHKTQRPLLRARLRSVYSCRAGQSDRLNLQTQSRRETQMHTHTQRRVTGVKIRLKHFGKLSFIDFFFRHWHQDINTQNFTLNKEQASGLIKTRLFAWPAY